jgi:integrase
VIELLLATGARKGEVLRLQWSDLNGGSWWTVPASVSKTKRAQRKPINSMAAATLALMPRGTDRVFEGVSESRLSKFWLKVRTETLLAGVRFTISGTSRRPSP